MVKCDCDGACLKKALRFSLFLVALFAVCFFWYWARPAAQDLMLQNMQMSYFWFSGMNVLSFISGAVQTFVWGMIIAGLWKLTVGCCCEKKD